MKVTAVLRGPESIGACLSSPWRGHSPQGSIILVPMLPLEAQSLIQRPKRHCAKLVRAQRCYMDSWAAALTNRIVAGLWLAQAS